MEQDPYVSPKEVGSPPTVRARMALGVLLLLTIPAGCILGGITCFSAGIVYQPPNMVNAYYAGWLLGIPIGLLIAVLIPLLAVLFFGKWRDAP